MYESVLHVEVYLYIKIFKFIIVVCLKFLIEWNVFYKNVSKYHFYIQTVLFKIFVFFVEEHEYFFLLSPTNNYFVSLPIIISGFKSKYSKLLQ